MWPCSRGIWTQLQHVCGHRAFSVLLQAWLRQHSLSPPSVHLLKGQLPPAPRTLRPLREKNVYPMGSSAADEGDILEGDEGTVRDYAFQVRSKDQLPQSHLRGFGDGD